MKQRLILVSGSNRGIGLAVVKEYLGLGHQVILTSRKHSDGKAVYKMLKSQYNSVFYHQLDVNQQESINQLYDFVNAQFGLLDVLVNNAAVNYDKSHEASVVQMEDVKRTLETNLIGPWALCNKFIPLMKRNRYGRIVNVSSGLGALKGMGGGYPTYSISKAALNVLTIKLAHELLDFGILVNSVNPGWVRTEMGGKMAPLSVTEGAKTIVWAGLLPNHGPTGKFLSNKEIISF